MRVAGQCSNSILVLETAMCDTTLVEIDVQRTITGAEICALYQAIGRISSPAVTYTKTFSWSGTSDKQRRRNLRRPKAQ